MSWVTSQRHHYTEPSSTSSSPAPEEKRLSSLQIQKTRTFAQDPQETQDKDLPNSIHKGFPDTFCDTVWLPVCVLSKDCGRRSMEKMLLSWATRGPAAQQKQAIVASLVLLAFHPSGRGQMAASQHLQFSSLLFLFAFCVLIVEVWGANLEPLKCCANTVHPRCALSPPFSLLF